MGLWEAYKYWLELANLLLLYFQSIREAEEVGIIWFFSSQINWFIQKKYECLDFIILYVQVWLLHHRMSLFKNKWKMNLNGLEDLAQLYWYSLLEENCLWQDIFCNIFFSIWKAHGSKLCVFILHTI